MTKIYRVIGCWMCPLLEEYDGEHYCGRLYGIIKNSKVTEKDQYHKNCPLEDYKHKQ
jgi:hypothetical protein